MKIRTILASAAAAATLAVSASQAQAAYEFYFTIEGVTQGAFKGESIRDRWQDALVGLAYSYEVQSPRDPATGRASGKRQHGPVTVTKEWGAATPQIFQALTTNELLTEVQFYFLRTSDQGEEYVYHRVTLIDATVSRIKQRTQDSTSTTTTKKGTVSYYDTMELEDVSFTFRRIDIENIDGSTMATDDWYTNI
jgi:type VI secretion system secreted protein Hcp